VNNIKSNNKNADHLINSATLIELRERLEYVIESTERAALETLDCVDRANHLLSNQPKEDGSSDENKAIKEELLKIMQAQEYQDLCSQVLEFALSTLNAIENDQVPKAASIELSQNSETHTDDESTGYGPEVSRDSEEQTNVASQDDIDALLDQFGSTDRE
jgi:chemotaxis regulatin CheY-phosphate phosphatase CheZ